MGQGGTIAVVFTLFVTIIGVGAGYFYYSTLPPEQKSVFCRDDDLELSFLINDKTQAIIMAGEKVNPSHIKIFNASAFEISWQSKSGTQTQMFMDRIAGKLEVETREDTLDDWKKIKLTCQHQAARF